MYLGQSSWTGERVDQLKKLHADGLSSSQIAAELGGISRNAVIGKITRLGLAGKGGRRIAARAAARPPKPARGGKVRIVVNNGGTDLDERPLNMTTIDAPVEQRKSFLQLTSDTCRFPYGDPGSPDFYFCGGTVLNGTPYCAAHARIAYTPYALRKRDQAVSFDPLKRSRFAS